MQRSDPPRPAGADAAAANSDPQKPAAESPSPEPADDAFAEADTEAIERTRFEALERETTQPVCRYFEPRSAIDITPADVGHAVDYAVPVEPVAPPPGREPSAPVADTPALAYRAPEWRESVRTPELEPQPAPSPEPPPATQHHDAAAAWSPTPTLRREPTYGRAEPSWQPHAATAPAPPLQPTARDQRDLFRRGARVAVLVFCGWLIAVMLLIVAYRFINPPFSMLMAQQFLTGTAIHKQWVPLERISPNLTRAVIVAEDGRFCDHWGVDFIEAANAIRRASDGYPRGASTITMQVAKNLFLVNTKSYLRKMVEIPLTFAIELAWPKWRILEVYLNVVEWGPGVFGAEAASQSHFGRSAAGLTSRQAAQLAVSLPNPIVRDAGSPGPRTAHRASVIQARAARTREASACVDGTR
jgi:monofunctional biosynthetic peptidoglycan transglycosylase